MLALALLLAQTPAQVPTAPEFAPDSSMFGWTVSAAGDHDGDGVPDLIIGEPQGHGDRLKSWTLSGKDGSTIRTFEVAFAHESMSSIQWGPDVDQDGIRDFLVLARAYRFEQVCELVLVSGRSGRELWRDSVGAALRGEPCARFIQDVNGDGVDDIAVLAPRPPLHFAFIHFRSGKTGEWLKDLLIPGSPTAYAGGLLEVDDLNRDGQRELMVLLDGEGVKHPIVRTCSRTSGGALWEMRCPDEWAGTSGALTLLGDLDRDGVHDVAAAFNDSVYVMSGGDGTVLLHLSPEGKTDSSFGFGQRIASLGDANGDGVCDLVISADEAGLMGAVSAYSGDGGWRMWTSAIPSSSDVYWFGQDLAPIGDVNGDGVTDVLVGSWAGSAAQPGYAALLSGRNGAFLFEFRRASNGQVVRRSPKSETQFH